MAPYVTCRPFDGFRLDREQRKCLSIYRMDRKRSTWGSSRPYGNIDSRKACVLYLLFFFSFLCSHSSFFGLLHVFNMDHRKTLCRHPLSASSKLIPVGLACKNFTIDPLQPPVVPDPVSSQSWRP